MTHSSLTSRGKFLARRSLMGLAAGTVMALALTACSGSSPLSSGTSTSTSSGNTVVVGSANFTESETIAEIYAGALNAAGVKTSTKLSIGARAVYVKAVEDGSIDVVPEYSGSLLDYVDPTNTVSAAPGVLTALKSKLPSGLSVLNASAAQDKDTMVVTPATAAKYGLKTVADLAKVCNKLSLGADPEFATRSDGLAGLKSLYGCVPEKFVPISDGGGPLTLKALLSNTIQVADIYSTTPSITANHLVALTDPKNLWAAQQVLPLVKTGTLNATATTALNNVSKLLTTEGLEEVNGLVSGSQKMNPQAAANQWLKENGIVK